MNNKKYLNNNLNKNNQNGYQVFPDQQYSTRKQNKWIYSTELGGDAIVSFYSQISEEIFFARISYANKKSIKIFENFFQRTIKELSDGYEYKQKEIREQFSSYNIIQSSIKQLSEIQLNIGSNDFGEHSIANKVIDSILRIESESSCPFQFQIETMSPLQSDSLCFSFEGILQTYYVSQEPDYEFQESYYEY